MFIIGLTGGFLTGKSTAANFLRRKNIAVIDVDKLYDGLLLRSVSLRKKLIKEFGAVIAEEGRVSRKRLRDMILDKPRHIKKLSHITHPYIIRELKARIKYYKQKPGILVVEAPLLYEAGLAKWFDKIIVVVSTLRNQLRRARLLGYRRKEALTLIKAQLPQKRKKELSDYVIINNRDIRELHRQTEKVFKYIKQDLGKVSGRS